MAVVFSFDGCEVSLFSHGRMLIKGTDSEQHALALYNKILGRIGASRTSRYA
jgi:hypothetical protein